MRKATFFPVTFVVDFHLVVMVVARWEVSLIWYEKVTKLLEHLRAALVAVLSGGMVVEVVALPARTARWVSCS